MDAIAVRTSAEPEKVQTYFDNVTLETGSIAQRLRAIKAIEEAGYDVGSIFNR